ncbi:rubrerythrin family protein [Halegenticoccus tardaugens]|uniref:rubrerythrin family protein n=1 Tax=Halegenticoccus tardaugens TaxID=2071624 RepID=UPI00100A499B|nr:rubrerythrin family protein [Halegenticoccus tardaugens]
MDADAFRETVEEEMGTELDRIGSSKLLVALTDAELERGPVLRAAANSEHAARETFRRWADGEADDGAREAFERVRDREAEHYERVVASMDEESFEPADGGPMHTYLRGREDTVERVASGLVGRGLVSLRTHAQLISFFVNEADEWRADLFRDLKRETGEEVDLGLELLAERCETDEDWDRARAVAEYVIRVAYDDYADSLEAMGVNPKSIC